MQTLCFTFGFWWKDWWEGCWVQCCGFILWGS